MLYLVTTLYLKTVVLPIGDIVNLNSCHFFGQYPGTYLVGKTSELRGVLLRHNIDSPDGIYMVGRNRQTSKPTFKPWIAGCIDI